MIYFLLKIIRYDIYGNYYGMETLTNQLSLCSKTYEDGIKFRDFGDSIHNNCYKDLYSLIDRNNTMYFYELFLKDPSNNGKLLDVPVMIDNIPNSKTGKTNNATDASTWILVRRFILWDNLSGLEGTGSFTGGTGTSKVIRFPKYMDLIVTLQPNPTYLRDSKIYIPYLEVYYRAKANDLLKTYNWAWIEFNSEYNMDISYFKTVTTYIFLTINLLIGAWWIVRMHTWVKTNPEKLSQVIKFNIINIIDSIILYLLRN